MHCDAVHEHFSSKNSFAVEPISCCGTLGPESESRIVSYEPTRQRIETRAPTNTILVVSEIFYPGWEALVDGRPTPINLVDFLLRGVALPSGHHIVEMRYTAPAARNGALIGLCSVVLMCGLAIYDRRRASRQVNHKETP